jgi:hypothetical protein
MTINALNYSTSIDLAEEWHGKINKIGYQFHTPFMKGDPLWLPFGEIRNDFVDDLISLKRKYPGYVINSEKQLSLMKGELGRCRDNTRSMSNLGYTFVRLYGKN